VRDRTMSDGLNDEDVDSLAAEYVLGTLDADERTRANVLLDVDHAFRAKVRAWEGRLGELHLMVEPVEPDLQILQRITARLGPAEPVSSVEPPAAVEQEIDESPFVSPGAPPAPDEAATAPELAQSADDPVAELERALERMRVQERPQAAGPAEPLPEPLVF